MTPFLSRKSEIVNSIEIRGGNDFILHTKAALNLLRPMPFFIEIQRYIGVIKQAKRSGMKAYAGKPTFKVGKPTWQHSAFWYASSMAHDAYHSKLYREAKSKNNGRRPDADCWTGTQAEKKCLAFQLLVLKELNADETMTAYVKALEKNPTYQGHNKGWRGWLDYLRRWW
jgi:hypothetical protein